MTSYDDFDEAVAALVRGDAVDYEDDRGLRVHREADARWWVLHRFGPHEGDGRLATFGPAFAIAPRHLEEPWAKLADGVRRAARAEGHLVVDLAVDGDSFRIAVAPTHRRAAEALARGIRARFEDEALRLQWLEEPNVDTFRLEVPDLFRDEPRGLHFPRVLDQLRRQIGGALLEAVGAALDVAPPARLGRTNVEEATIEVDRVLLAADRQLDFLSNLNPCNLQEAYRAFHGSGFEDPPEFEYRPLQLDPLVLKRRIYAAPFDEVEDPVQEALLRRMIEERDLKLSLLARRGTKRCLETSLELYGSPSEKLVDLAEQILQAAPPHEREVTWADAVEFRRALSDELQWYGNHDEALCRDIEERDDVAAGVMVENGRLIVNRDYCPPSHRVQALVAHEVGTHVVTWCNGNAQPLKVFRTGLAGYEDTQEGLAVLGEHLVGGLEASRLRVLAGRVVAANALFEGGGFVDVFRVLTRSHGFAPKEAWGITARLFRGGGLTKDIVYLRGLVELLRFLHGGEEITDLFVGKIALADLADVRDLLARGVLRAPKIIPRHLESDDARRRLADVVQQSLDPVALARIASEREKASCV